MQLIEIDKLLSSPYIELKLNAIAELKDGAPPEIVKQYTEYRKTIELWDELKD